MAEKIKIMEIELSKLNDREVKAISTSILQLKEIIKVYMLGRGLDHSIHWCSRKKKISETGFYTESGKRFIDLKNNEETLDKSFKDSDEKGVNKWW